MYCGVNILTESIDWRIQQSDVSLSASVTMSVYMCRDGMQKMREVYTQNSKLGDPASIDKQLQENALKLDKLMLERKKFEVSH